MQFFCMLPFLTMNVGKVLNVLVRHVEIQNDGV